MTTREGQDDAGTRAGTNTRDVADSEAGLQGDVATETVSMEQCVHNTAHRASIHSTPYGRGHDAYRTMEESTDGTNRTGATAGTAEATEGQCVSTRTGVDASARRAPGHDGVFSERSRENSREEVLENNETRFKTGEERSGWWEALKKRLYRDMG